MREIYIKSKAGLLPIGRRGENLATRVHLAETPAEGQAVTVYVLRNGDTVAYPASNVEIADSEIIWTVTSTDTGKSGRGKVQYKFADATTGEIIKTEIYGFIVGLAIDTEVGPAPDPYESWLDSLTDLAGQAQVAARDAEDYAESASESAESASESAQNAEQSASSAGESADIVQMAMPIFEQIAQRTMNSADAARNSEIQAQVASERAVTAQMAAESAARQASASAESASASKTAAEAARQQAYGWAQSSQTYSEAASASAGRASASKTSAGQSATAASASATSASQSATTATAKAAEASASATTAATKASEASASATSASGSATTATTKASEASASASAAAGSASSAQTAQAAAEAAQTAAEAAAQTLVIESTLTQTGQAADAKTTGDKISIGEKTLNGAINTGRSIQTFQLAFGYWQESAGTPVWYPTANKSYLASSGPVKVSAGDVIHIMNSVATRYFALFSADGITWSNLVSTTNHDFAINADGYVLISVRNNPSTSAFTEEDLNTFFSDRIVIVKAGQTDEQTNRIDNLDGLTGLLANKAGFSQVYVTNSAQTTQVSVYSGIEFPATYGDTIRIKASLSVDYPENFGSLELSVRERYNNGSIRTTNYSNLSDIIDYAVNKSATTSIQIVFTLNKASESSVTTSYYENITYSFAAAKKEDALDAVLTESGDTWEV